MTANDKRFVAAPYNFHFLPFAPRPGINAAIPSANDTESHIQRKPAIPHIDKGIATQSALIHINHTRLKRFGRRHKRFQNFRMTEIRKQRRQADKQPDQYPRNDRENSRRFA